MKVIVLFKTPAVIDYAVDRIDHRPEDEQEELREFLEQWIQYGETLRVEFDTEAGTAKVLGR